MEPVNWGIIGVHEDYKVIVYGSYGGIYGYIGMPQACSHGSTEDSSEAEMSVSESQNIHMEPFFSQRHMEGFRV